MCSRSARRRTADSVVTGAILVAGLVLAAVGIAISFLGMQVIHRVFPPVVTGGVVMLIGFGLAFVVADVYWQQDRWVALITMFAAVPDDRAAARLLEPDRDPARPGLRLRAVLGARQDRWRHHRRSTRATGEVDTHPRVNFDSVKAADWIGFPDLTAPDFKFSAILLVLPAVIA